MGAIRTQIMHGICVLRTYGIAVIVFLFPWQTVWILQRAFIGRHGTPFEGLWQYGTTRIYALDILIWCVVLLHSIASISSLSDRRIPMGLRQFYSSRFFYLDSALILFLVFSGLSIVWSPFHLVSIWAWLRLCEGVVIFWILRASRIPLSLFVGSWILAAVLQGALACLQFSVQAIPGNTLAGIASHSSAQLGDSVIQAGDRRWLRAYGSFPHPNVLGAYLALSLVVCISSARFFKKKLAWLLCIIAASMITVGIFFSFSRTAWLALVIGGLCAGIASWVKRKHTEERTEHSGMRVVSPVAACIVCVVIVFGVLSLTFHEELGVRFGVTPSSLERASVQDRVSIIHRALPLLGAEWYRGTGIGAFTGALFEYEKGKGKDSIWYLYQPIHNVPLLIVAELGVIGGIISLMIFFLLFWSIRSSSSALGLLIPLAVMSMTDHYFWTLLSGICLFWMTGAYVFLAQQETVTRIHS